MEAIKLMIFAKKDQVTAHLYNYVYTVSTKNEEA